MQHSPLPRCAPLSTLADATRESWLWPETNAPALQPAGEAAAERVLATFLEGRGVGYRSEMSTPVEGWAACSRLSPHLAWGNVSMRSIYLRTRARVEDVRERKKRGDPDLDKRWPQALASFEKRLRWQSHFMQKLEDEPDLDTQPLHPGFAGLRMPGEDETALDETERERRLSAWQAGRTGYPMVDACMRAVAATGWLNFRMRAMVQSFAAYHLWLPWQDTGRYLARCFVDYEPGIHWSQIQMQSGVTGINAVRIYSPAKQVRDQDPTGQFIRRWVPELRDVPDDSLPEPHLWEGFAAVGGLGGLEYPPPIVDHREAYDAARKRVYAWRRRQEVKALTPAVLDKHGSRRRASRRGARREGAKTRG
jgi:deoxyribodipyrimidine photo-lyase